MKKSILTILLITLLILTACSNQPTQTVESKLDISDELNKITENIEDLDFKENISEISEEFEDIDSKYDT